MRAGLNHNLLIQGAQEDYVFVYLYLSDSGLLLAQDCVQGIYMRETTLQDIGSHCPGKLPSLYLKFMR